MKQERDLVRISGARRSQFFGWMASCDCRLRAAFCGKQGVSFSATRYLWFQTFWAAMAISLFAVTLKLWVPQVDFPQIPVFGFLVGTPMWVDGAALAILVGSLLVWVSCCVADVVRLLRLARKCQTGWKPIPRQKSYDVCYMISLSLFVLASLVLVSLNQHRLQPWLYQFIVFAIIMGSCSRGAAVTWMRRITISIYFFSAISKFDFQFVTTLGRDFLSTSVGFLGLETGGWHAGIVGGLVLLFPVYELLLAVGLMFRRTRRPAMVGIVAMHTMLLLILGPFGLGHQPGVLVWNLYLLGQAIFLFGGEVQNEVAVHGFTECHSEGASFPQENSDRRISRQISAASQNSDGERWLASGLAGSLAAFVLLFPLSVSVGLCDHWLAWEVYAPRTSRAQLEIGRADVLRLPTKLQTLCGSPDEETGFCLFSLNRWSIKSLGVPIYPEDRFQFSLAAWLIDQSEVRQFRLHVGGVSDRWTGKRKWKTLSRRDEIERFRDGYFLNTLSR